MSSSFKIMVFLMGTLILCWLCLLNLLVYKVHKKSEGQRTSSVSTDQLQLADRQKNYDEFVLTSDSDRYPHGALGDAFEPTQIYRRIRDGEFVPFISLPEHQVFETNRLIFADITGDSREEILTTVSDASRGAAVVVYDRETATEVARTDFIGTRFRWRLLVGVIHDQNNQPYLVDVVTPHLTGTLTLYAPEDSQLVPVDQHDGYFSHVYGSSDLSGAQINTDETGAENLLITPDFEQWHTYRVVDGMLEGVDSR